MKYLIGIDIGTSGTKTVLFDESGKILASASREYPLLQPHNGWAEQNPQDWYDAAIETLKKVVSESGVAASDIVSLGISGQMHGLVMLDENNDQLGIMSLNDAKSYAYEHGYDLVMIAPTANPPVCRAMDYGKYRFERDKKEKEAKKKAEKEAIKNK